MAQHPHPAAAVEEERDAWSDALDVDDSDLRHNPPSSLPLCLLRPCTSSRPRAPHHQRIPGPTSSVEGAMRLGFSDLSSGPVPAARAGDQAAADDFLLGPWLCALRFLGEDRAWQRTGIGAIRGDRTLYRAPVVVGMVTLCTPNGLGDLFLNLKDPTSTIGATVHKKVISDGNLGKGISVGSVIILKQVAVFRPSRTSCYLNVTQQNVVKVGSTVLLMTAKYPNKEIVAYATIISTNPKANVGGVETGKQFYKVRINHPVEKDEPLVRHMPTYNNIGDAHAKGVPIAWPSIFVQMING